MGKLRYIGFYEIVLKRKSKYEIWNEKKFLLKVQHRNWNWIEQQFHPSEQKYEILIQKIWTLKYGIDTKSFWTFEVYV